MEIRNNTPSFGMAFIKPTEKVMQVLEQQVDRRSIEAFIKEQSKAKYFDITAKPAYSLREGKNGAAICFEVVPKEGVDTLGHEGRSFHSEGRFPNYITRIKDEYRSQVDEIAPYYRSNKIKKFLFKNVIIKITNFCMKKDIKNVKKHHPERMVLPALRAAGDEVFRLEHEIDKVNGFSKLFDA